MRAAERFASNCHDHKEYRIDHVGFQRRDSTEHSDPSRTFFQDGRKETERKDKSKPTVSMYSDFVGLRDIAAGREDMFDQTAAPGLQLAFTSTTLLDF